MVINSKEQMGWATSYYNISYGPSQFGTQYAKGRYAVRRNSVISYADINFYFKKVQFSLKKHNTHDMYKVK